MCQAWASAGAGRGALQMVWWKHSQLARALWEQHAGSWCLMLWARQPLLAACAGQLAVWKVIAWQAEGPAHKQGLPSSPYAMQWCASNQRAVRHASDRPTGLCRLLHQACLQAACHRALTKMNAMGSATHSLLL